MLCALPSLLPAANTIDRIVAVVGKAAIKQSDIDRDLRVTQFLNQEPIDLNVAAQRKALDRLIDQELIRADMMLSGNTGHMDAEAKELLDATVRERFGGSQARLELELRRRGLKDAQLLQQLQLQLVVLRFIDQRFRPGVIVSDEEVKKYYDEHLNELSRAPGEHTLSALTPKVRETLEGEQVNKNFEEWLDQARKAAVIQYKVPEFKADAPK